jgi:hypothetical protein
MVSHARTSSVLCSNASQSQSVSICTQLYHSCCSIHSHVGAHRAGRSVQLVARARCRSSDGRVGPLSASGAPVGAQYRKAWLKSRPVVHTGNLACRQRTDAAKGRWLGSLPRLPTAARSGPPNRRQSLRRRRRSRGWRDHTVVTGRYFHNSSRQLKRSGITSPLSDNRPDPHNQPQCNRQYGRAGHPVGGALWPGQCHPVHWQPALLQPCLSAGVPQLAHALLETRHKLQRGCIKIRSEDRHWSR